MKSTEAEYKRLKSDHDAACRDRAELLDRIQDAEGDLKEMSNLMAEYKKHGKQSEFEELDDSYQQAYPDYTKLLQRLSDLQSRIEELAVRTNSIDDYVRDTGLYPGV